MRTQIIALVGIIVIAVALAAGCSSTFTISNSDPPCYGGDLDDCRQAQYELQPIAKDTCSGTEKRVCLVPVASSRRSWSSSWSRTIASSTG